MIFFFTLSIGFMALTLSQARSSYAQCYSNSPHAPNSTANDLSFEGTAEPLAFKAFIIEDQNGKALPKDKAASLSLGHAEKNRRKQEMQELEIRLEDNGFHIDSTACENSFADRIMRVGDYEAEINGIERKLNAQGQSLRQAGAINVQEHQKFAIEKLNHELSEGSDVYAARHQELYDQTMQKISEKYRDLQAKQEQFVEGQKKLEMKDLYTEAERHKCLSKAGDQPSEADIDCFLGTIDEVSIPAASPLTDPSLAECGSGSMLGKTFLHNESWIDAGGDQNFGWTGHAQFKLRTDAQGLVMQANTKIDGLVLNQSIPIIEGNSQFVSPRTGKTSGSIKLAFAGKNIINENPQWDLTLIDSKDAEGKERYMIHKEQRLLSTTIPLGFVPVLLMVDMKASAGPSYGLNLAPIRIWGKAEWSQSANIIASAGVGTDLQLFVILAGVKGAIELASFTIGSYPEAAMDLDSKGRPMFNARLWAGAKMRTLAGSLNLGVWAQSTFAIPQPKGDFPFLEMKPLSYEWSKKLGNYPGYDFPQAILFDKKVGYDVCSGRKTVEIFAEKMPRSTDQRQSLEAKEALRIGKLEAELIQILDDDLYNEKSTRPKNEVEQELARLHQLQELRQQVTSAVIGTHTGL